jgi:hypothetical protein
MRKNQFALGIVGALVLLAGAVWGLGWLQGEDPTLAELAKLRDEGFAQGGDMASRRDEFRKRMEGLSEDQRRAFFQQSMPMMMKMFERRVDEFLALSPQEQRKRIDERLDQHEASRGKGDGSARDGFPGGGGPGGGNAPGVEKFDQMRKQMLDVMTPEQRAKMGTYMKQYAERAEQRGMDPGIGGAFL